jgi:threonylcarbamoyladenosine tRNA methylthiotransferase MtaB
MPQLDHQTIKARAARLRDKGRIVLDAHLAREIGATRSVLMEKGGVGRTEHFTPVSMPGIAAGTIVPAHIVGRTASGLLATPLAEAA